MRRPRGFDRQLVCGLGVTLLLAWPLQGCKRKAVPRDAETKPRVQVADKSGPAWSGDRLARARVVKAAWYEVPMLSLAKRRAGLSELTAAHNKLPIGTRVRVTRLSNGKSVDVRITDRGIHQDGVKLDLCKEAAEELDMLATGVTRVRMQVITENDGSAPPEPSASPSP